MAFTGEDLKVVRSKLNFSQEDLAKEISELMGKRGKPLTKAAISYWENGGDKPIPSKYEKAVGALLNENKDQLGALIGALAGAAAAGAIFGAPMAGVYALGKAAAKARKSGKSDENKAGARSAAEILLDAAKRPSLPSDTCPWCKSKLDVETDFEDDTFASCSQCNNLIRYSKKLNGWLKVL